MDKFKFIDVLNMMYNDKIGSGANIEINGEVFKYRFSDLLNDKGDSPFDLYMFRNVLHEDAKILNWGHIYPYKER